MKSSKGSNILASAGAGLLLLASSPLPAAVSWNEMQFSGFLSQGYLKTSANAGLKDESIDAATIKSVFRGKKVSWNNKTPVTVAILKGGGVHEEFLKEAFNISPSAFSNYWRLTAMSGGASAPKEFASEDDLLKFVAATPGAIGYVDDARVTADVRSIPVE